MKRAMVCFFAVLVPLAASAQTYRLKGTVVGFMQWKADAACYVAIKDSTNTYYSLGYHKMEDKALCSLASMALLTGTKVWATAEVRSGTTNEIRTIELLKEGALPHWPPYGARSSRSRD